MDMSGTADTISVPNMAAHHHRHIAPKGPNSSGERSFVLWPSGEPTTEFAGTWTTVTGDTDIVQHLLALYFCWEYPTFASLSKEHYLKDFHDGRNRYCSSLLTNALLALGCRFSNMDGAKDNTGESLTSGKSFFRECERLYFDETDHRSITTVQALGIMAIREASCGRISMSEFYSGQCMRLAIEMGLHRIGDSRPQNDTNDDERTVRLATFWGAFTLDK